MEGEEEEDLTCAVCFKTYYKPVRWPRPDGEFCHAFCMECTSTWALHHAATYGESAVVPCPTCRAPSDPMAGWRRLPIETSIVERVRTTLPEVFAAQLEREAVEALDLFVGRYLLLATVAYVGLKFVHFKIFDPIPYF